ncbi:MAG: DNA alkylation repair protein [Kiritimatiellia bacterium]
MKTTILKPLRTVLRDHANPADAETLRRFFKTGPGEYAEGDIFIGVRVPIIRRIAKEYQTLPLREATTLLKSKTHEERMLALVILMHQYEKGTPDEQTKIYNLYMANTAHINNWDLIDVTAPHIVGAFLQNQPRAPIYDFARSDSLWERRIAIIATLHFIKNCDFEDTLAIAEILLHDKHDLIHKAVGWMLREVGKRDIHTQKSFLKKHYPTMPRTMLRYAIEKFPEESRQRYLTGIA